MTEPEHAHDRRRDDMADRVEQWRASDVEITEFSGRTVAYLPDVEESWICGWVDVPR
ncbi:hypothetical protein EGH21_02865 [Halomicroarcula sp. F13]|uniref:GNAT family N-acetyltransferase n=1 Tax=Haloarcula rubra TaxID=2487747 RepID=A0AAW4PNQ0_9EURY|nr:hypothetical protein [Halomicroarcula rubra]MBX0321967.1 hypothetical protein [Halomicroarcula rubra]